MKGLVKKCDVLVAGGGAAGVAAAIAAARRGCKVVLVEKYGFLGGMATAGSVGTICGLYIRDGKTAEFAQNQFAFEWAANLIRRSRSAPQKMAGGHWVLPYEPTQFILLADAMLQECTNIEVILHGVIISAEVDNGNINTVGVMAWAKLLNIQPLTVVDCTGDATLIGLAGGELIAGCAEQSPAVVFDMLSVSGDLTNKQDRLGILRLLAEAVGDGRLPCECRGISFVPMAGGLSGAARFKIGFNYKIADQRQDITRLEMRARRVVNAVAGFLQENISSFKNSHLRFSVQAGIRSSIRAVGKSRLTGEDVINCRKTELDCPHGTWPVEIWNGGITPTITCLPEGGYYTIPKDCQTAKKIGNAFMAGRCLSATSTAIASARVIGTALQTGFAAGRYAAEMSGNHNK